MVRRRLDYTGNVQLHDHFYVAPTAYPDTSTPTHVPLFVGDAVHTPDRSSVTV